MKFSNLDDLISDEKKELEGIEIPLGKDRYITIRRAGGANLEFDAAMTEAVLRLKEKNPDKEITDEVAFNLSRDIFAKSVLIGWRGILDNEGKEVPFSKENAKELLKLSRDLVTIIHAESGKQVNFRIEETKKAAKK